MRACSMASGGVMFISDDIERSTRKDRGKGSPVKYDTFIGEASENSKGALQQSPSTEDLKNAA